MPPKNPASVPLEVRAVEAVTETVDLTNGNIHLKIPIRAAHQKSTAPRSDH
jgi:hypothetical protein